MRAIEQPPEPPVPLDVPASITPEWVATLQAALDAATRAGPAALAAALPAAAACALLDRAQRLLAAEPTLVEVTPAGDDVTVTVVGDTHGQFHDVCAMLALVGAPSPRRVLVFNGDFVDRGAWGVETLALLCAWKLAAPASVVLLRGNHESATCTLMYGFKGELVAKYGRGAWNRVYTSCKHLFGALPLAARVARATLVLHGGLFRAAPARAAPAPPAAKGAAKRKRAAPAHLGAAAPGALTLGSLDDLRRASKGGLDPSGLGASRVAADVLWSDPVREPGLLENDARGIGLTFGPDVTERFLRDNGLRLVLRSHEGPDAREGRDDMAPMLEGWTLDHDTPAGRLMTVFSAPDYPQFVHEAAARYRNRAAVAVLSAAGGWADPAMTQFDAVEPRPAAAPYYDLAAPDSDEEFEPAPSDASGMTGVVRSEGEEDDGEVAGGAGAAASPPRPGRTRSPSRSPSPSKRRAPPPRSPANAPPRSPGKVPPRSPGKAAAVAAAPAPAAEQAAHPGGGSQENGGGHHLVGGHDLRGAPAEAAEPEAGGEAAPKAAALLAATG